MLLPERSQRPPTYTGRQLAAWIMAVWLFGCMAFQYHPRTVAGTHCPTAPVQILKVAIRDCCGKIVGFKAHVPQPGETQFLQCHCAEKKGAESGVWIPPKLEPFFLPEFELLAIAPPSFFITTREPVAEELAEYGTPPVRPPILS